MASLKRRKRKMLPLFFTPRPHKWGTKLSLRSSAGALNLWVNWLRNVDLAKVLILFFFFLVLQFVNVVIKFWGWTELARQAAKCVTEMPSSFLKLEVRTGSFYYYCKTWASVCVLNYWTRDIPLSLYAEIADASVVIYGFLPLPP